MTDPDLNVDPALVTDPALATEPALLKVEPARKSLEVWRAELEDSMAELEEAAPILTLLMVFLTTTSVSWMSVDFSLRTEAAANTLSLDLNWLRVDSASSALFSAHSN